MQKGGTKQEYFSFYKDRKKQWYGFEIVSCLKYNLYLSLSKKAYYEIRKNGH